MNAGFSCPLPGGPNVQTPTRVVVHAMGEYILTENDEGDKQVLPAIEFLRKEGLSAHSLITCSGVNIRCRRDDQGAWHAKGFNTNSLGIEFLVPGVYGRKTYHEFAQMISTDYISPRQWESGVEQVRRWMALYHIARMDRHSDVDPARKIDPGPGFNWTKFLEAIS